MQSTRPSVEDFDQLADLRTSILEDVFKDFNHVRKRWIRKLLEPLAFLSINRFAELMLNLDNVIYQEGFRQALEDLAAYFVNDIRVFGNEHIPKQGPLLIVSNHPGTIDSAAIGAKLPRDDLNIIATGFPLLQRLPYASQRLIFINPHAPLNLSGARSTISHLRAGGAVLIFPSGRVEPDPAIMPTAIEKIQNWSTSIEFFLRKVPQTQVMVTVVSGVLSPLFLRNPINRLLRGIRDPLAIAEVAQIVTQMIFKKRFRMNPLISFDLPHSVDELRREYESIYQAVLIKADQLMRKHLVISNQASKGKLVLDP
jgi:1-acyl-sn-glycerol-3-phosphate acyltransferase